ncbi:Qat anti-phage system QueC-like protein QatC [Amniculibacterium aquaticum]|uniref:Qat anti-phage system QueC-like protein QatC n=1 Tax=Amniculibacterium aquaticum TaxID=2479858 RepID=UPI000F5955C5|nr:Qat anti-phage system QueC-like protein QatC [Amniculibacterium aquaticum]
MKNIVFKLNKGDSFQVDNSDYEIDFTKKNDFHSTFYKFKRRIYKMPNFFQKEALDLYYISLMIYYADRKILRTGTYDNWTRQFKLYIPVLELDKWNNNKLLFTDMMNYLSGDLWEFEFRQRELNLTEEKYLSSIKNHYVNKKLSIDYICMLSGGLDSFIGAIDILSNNKDVAFVGHYGGGKGVKPFQDKVRELLKNKFSINDEQFFNFNATAIGGIEDSTRTRSFLFFSLAIILASSFDKEIRLYIPENGLISLNIPLTNTRLGSSSTRTTHPYYLSLFQKLLDNLGVKVKLYNPYQFFTKGEMLKNCIDNEFIKENYISTMSCSHSDQVRYSKGKKPKHCGTCLPCTIRRASIVEAFNIDNTEYEDPNYKKPKAKNELKSFKIGVLDYKANPNNQFTIQIAGNLKTNFGEFKDLYKRGMKELSNFLDSINE